MCEVVSNEKVPTGLSSLVSQPMYSATVIIWSMMESISTWSKYPFLSVSYIRNITEIQTIQLLKESSVALLILSTKVPGSRK